jgi:hypothetical protein
LGIPTGAEPFYPVRTGGAKRQESSAFLKKSAQKTFAPGGVWGSVAIKPNRRLGLIGTRAQTPAEQKFFCFFFFKKRSACLPSLPSCPVADASALDGGRN